MAKIPTCRKANCTDSKLKKPGNTTLFHPFCVEHQIEANLNKIRAERTKDKAGLDNMRERVSKSHNRTKSPKQTAMDRADSWFSKYIRLKYSYESGSTIKCKCYTCDKEHDILDIENGHFQSRMHKSTRYGLNNARPQDPYCNKHLNGNNAEFEKRLIIEIGKDKVETVKSLARSEGEDNEAFYRSMSDTYRKLFKALLIEKEIESPWKS